MSMISARVLELLSLLQSRRRWSGNDLASRLEVSSRTLRRDIESLKDLGYPITTVRGTGGGYQLAPSMSLPPLVLSEDEAAIIVIALKEFTTGNYPTDIDAARGALNKVLKALPPKVQRRVLALRHLEIITTEDHPSSVVDAAVLTVVATASRQYEEISFKYCDAQMQTTFRRVQPHYVVSFNQRFYLLAYDLDKGDWRNFRIDRITSPESTGRVFAPRRIPASSPAEFIQVQISKTPSAYEIEATVSAPAEQIYELLGNWGTATITEETSCVVQIRANDLDWALFSLIAMQVPFTIQSPDEAVQRAGEWCTRLFSATNRNKKGITD